MNISQRRRPDPGDAPQDVAKTIEMHIRAEKLRQLKLKTQELENATVPREFHEECLEEVADVLLNSMRHIGRALGCGAIHVHLPEASDWAMGHFENHGHHLEGTTLCCHLGAS